MGLRVADTERLSKAAVGGPPVQPRLGADQPRQLQIQKQAGEMRWWLSKRLAKVLK
jgi:hypothetical protein